LYHRNYSAKRGSSRKKGVRRGRSRFAFAHPFFGLIRSMVEQLRIISKRRGNVPKVSSKNMFEPLEPSGRCVAIPKLSRRYFRRLASEWTQLYNELVIWGRVVVIQSNESCVSCAFAQVEAPRTNCLGSTSCFELAAAKIFDGPAEPGIWRGTCRCG